MADLPPDVQFIPASDPRVLFHSSVDQGDLSAHVRNNLPLHDTGVRWATSPDASWSFTFSGNYMQVTGYTVPYTIEDGPVLLPAATFALDGIFGQSVTVLEPTSTGAAVTYYALSAAMIPLAGHSLTINVTQATPNNPFLLDQILVAVVTNAGDISSEAAHSTSLNPALSISTDPGVTTTAMSSASTMTRASSSIIATTQSSQGSHSVPATPSPSTGTSNSSSALPLAPVIGAAVGGTIFLAALIALLFYLWRRSQRRGKPHESGHGRGKGGESGTERSEDPNQARTPDAAMGCTTSASLVVPTAYPTASGSSAVAASAHHPWASMQSSVNDHILPLDMHQQHAPPTMSDARTHTIYSSSVPWEEWSGHTPERSWSPESSASQRHPTHITSDYHGRHSHSLSSLAAPAEVSRFTVLPSNGSAAGSRMDYSSTADDDGGNVPRRRGMRMLGGVVEYDGKETRLTSGIPGGAEGSSGSAEKEGMDAPPAYAP